MNDDRFLRFRRPPAGPDASSSEDAEVQDDSPFSKFRTGGSAGEAGPATSVGISAIPLRKSRPEPRPSSPLSGVSSVAPSGAFDLSLSDEGPVGEVLTSPVGSGPNRPAHTLLATILTETPLLEPGKATVLGVGGTPSVVALSRVQSGIGAIRFTLDSPSKGQMRLGMLIEHVDGTQAMVDASKEAFPVATALPGGEVLLNERRVRDLRRALVFVTVSSPQVAWEGMVTATLPSGTKAHAPISFPNPGENAVAFSVLVVDGRVVLRAEEEHAEVPLRVMAERYGYARLAWSDDRTPIGS